MKELEARAYASFIRRLENFLRPDATTVEKSVYASLAVSQTFDEEDAHQIMTAYATLCNDEYSMCMRTLMAEERYRKACESHECKCESCFDFGSERTDSET